MLGHHPKFMKTLVISLGWLDLGHMGHVIYWHRAWWEVQYGRSNDSYKAYVQYRSPLAWDIYIYIYVCVFYIILSQIWSYKLYEKEYGSMDMHVITDFLLLRRNMILLIYVGIILLILFFLDLFMIRRLLVVYFSN